MTADDLSAPLGLQPKRRRRKMNIPVPQIIAGALALFLAAFVLWAVVADDPFGGEPIAAVPANLKIAAKPPDATSAPPPAASADAGQRHDMQAGMQADMQAAPAIQAAAPAQAVPANGATVTIIDGKTGTKQDIVVPSPT